MALAIIEAHVDENLKAAAERIMADAGLNASEVMRMVLNKIVAEQYVSLDLFHPNQETLDAMAEMDRGGLPTYATVAELMADLNADD